MALTGFQRRVCRLLAHGRKSRGVFPLVEHEDFGLTLHPYDLATNKVLAMVGRLEARDWIDVISAHERVQHLGLLLWGACGKDPGFGPGAILNHARRSRIQGAYPRVLPQ